MFEFSVTTEFALGQVVRAVEWRALAGEMAGTYRWVMGEEVKVVGIEARLGGGVIYRIARAITRTDRFPGDQFSSAHGYDWADGGAGQERVKVFGSEHQARAFIERENATI